MIHHRSLRLAVIDLAAMAAGSVTTAQSGLQSVVILTSGFQALLGPADNIPDSDPFQGLGPTFQQMLRERCCRQILNALLIACYGPGYRLKHEYLEAPCLGALTDPQTGTTRYLELVLTAEPEVCPVDWVPLQVTAADPSCFDCLGWEQVPTPQQVTDQLLTPNSALNQWLAEGALLQPGVSGYLLLSGQDVTQREVAQRLVQWLIHPDPGASSPYFAAVNQQLLQLFRADDSLLLKVEPGQAQLFLGLDQDNWETTTFAIDQPLPSSLRQATEQGQVVTVPDLQVLPSTPIEQILINRGGRSVLIIPLSTWSRPQQPETPTMVGLLLLTSTRPSSFSLADCSYATLLIPAIATALRRTIPDRFATIHPSVRWRFEQEAERRSWGLAAAAIVFEQVCPLYGISDIRGSSEARNRAIQTDLLKQFQLALTVIQSASQAVPNALLTQLQLDLDAHRVALAQGISVDAEVTLMQYLQQTIEAHFDSLLPLSPTTAAAIQAYRQSLHPIHGCIYEARARYDDTINQINHQLRRTWDRWQTAMQGITPHYCDIEVSDGIDHMIYAGEAIDPHFSDFKLKSLRYEQLRAMCDCARQGLNLQTSCGTNLELTHLVLVQRLTVDIMHDETTERLFDVRGTRDTRYEIVKKRIDKACDAASHDRITQPGMLTVVYSTSEEWQEYHQYLRYLHREGLVDGDITQGLVEPLQGVSGLKFARVKVCPEPTVAAAALSDR